MEVVAAKPRAAGPIQKRVTLWHKVQKRKVVGNAAPLEKNVHTYLAKHPEYEIYDAHGHEKEKDIQRAVEKVSVRGRVVGHEGRDGRKGRGGEGRLP